MDSNWKLCPLLIFILATCIHQGISIKCWECNSAIHRECADPFDNSTMSMVDCDSRTPALIGTKPKVCRKIRQQVNGETRIYRTCAYLSESDIVGTGKLGLTTTTSPNTISTAESTAQPTTTSLPTTSSLDTISTEQPTTTLPNRISTEETKTDSSNRISIEYFTCNDWDGCNGI